jgi:hypothetical protein
MGIMHLAISRMQSHCKLFTLTEGLRRPKQATRPTQLDRLDLLQRPSVSRASGLEKPFPRQPTTLTSLFLHRQSHISTSSPAIDALWVSFTIHSKPFLLCQRFL